MVKETGGNPDRGSSEAILWRNYSEGDLKDERRVGGGCKVMLRKKKSKDTIQRKKGVQRP